MTFPQPLVFLRHGVTDWNRQARYQGSTDIELSADGRRMMLGQAALIERLCDLETLDRNQLLFVSSPLVRARQSATEIAAHMGRHEDTLQVEDRLRELSMGRWEGLTSQQVKDRFYKERKGRKTNRWTFAAADGGESMAERATSIMQAVAGLPPHSIVVTHAVVLRILLHELGQQPQAEAAQAAIPHQGLYVLDKSQFQLFGEEGVSAL
ncbi:histidine phosphatase family protein [Ahrensia sp. R2A130]|uniref:histidine phosphatase family protein n=1 Tax=Ahrensia sp. R2A130 TaxID=744979 RepID=UPI0001E0E8F6|nr:histidine phosphatase family protein [Ahrensia sp. R2A130]EFL88016.1 phosphoglycerate mutase [Ahrensia sp. R2A130]